MSSNNWNSNEWMNLGREIRDMVEQAVTTQDFGELSGKISETVAEGLDHLSDSLRQNGRHSTSERYRSGEAAGPSRTGYRERHGGGAGNGGGGYATGNGAGRYGAAGTAGNGAGRYGTANRYNPPVRNTGTALQNPLYARTLGEQAGGTALAAVGYTVAGGSSIALLIMSVIGMVGAWTGGMTAASAVLSIIFAGASVMAWQGTRLLGKVRRFRKYIAGMKGNTFCSIRELAAMVGKKEKYVLNDVRKMIGNGWFRQGHLDRQETCLIVSDETYRQYEASQQQLELRQRQELENKKKEQLESDGLSPEIREMVRAGNEYIARMKKSNDAIPGEEISNKIERIQMIVERIFQRVKDRPEYAGDLRKFMDYYLPTTVKLLDAYEELDRQPVQGENIRNGKLEIEKTLDTLNVAYEKLLDSLFEDTAWDVSTDISVLKTMLAQEGLTDSGLRTGGLG